LIDATPRALNAHGVNVKAHHRDRRFTGNQNGKRKVVVKFGSETAISSAQFSNTESQAASLIRARIAKGTVVHADEAAAGITHMSVSRSRESTIKRHTASMARALTWLKNTSHVCVVPRSPFTTISLVRISSDMHKSPHGVRRVRRWP
jgi:hypothetical protein